MRALDLLRDWLHRKLRIRDPRNRVIRITPDAVTLHDRLLDEELWRVPWSTLEEIVAFKVDAYIVDHICLGFLAEGAGTLWVAVEESEGWKELIAELERRYGVMFEEWFPRVAFPAFKENRTVLWRRAGMPGEVKE